MTNEELLNEAKRRYPIGTKFISTLGYKDEIYEETWIRWSNTSICAELIGKNGDTISNRFIYSDGKWANVISTPNPVLTNYVVC